MRGQVIKYFDDKGYGFIKDENGDNRFFHISNLIGTNDKIHPSALVKFTPNSNEKGLTCLNIEVLKRNKTNFISINNTNIKVSNIKEFGISLSHKIKAIKVPVYKMNPDYVKSKERAGKNILKKLLLPEKYINAGTYKEIFIEKFEKYTIQGNEFRYSRDVYELPYIFIKQSETKDVKHDGYTRIDADEAKFVYWKYLYITTYQNDNYKFYEHDINIEENISQINELINYVH
ncbi:hypothetical protein GMD78_08445 [Ornithinibacillus sp. L9]|uniref:CSD domain-containing protein n=1 Tax=Ornithinibacillus caprae TaxID=2678566 RepID=A0A6N8FM72_9BACI|nr:cold shock domain-containing protein [Ornithinibacillus caprae]MUK88418.1 hypothetical protein [Ornithinibacillus caprae]